MTRSSVLFADSLTSLAYTSARVYFIALGASYRLGSEKPGFLVFYQDAFLLAVCGTTPLYKSAETIRGPSAIERWLRFVLESAVCLDDYENRSQDVFITLCAHTQTAIAHTHTC